MYYEMTFNQGRQEGQTPNSTSYVKQFIESPKVIFLFQF